MTISEEISFAQYRHLRERGALSVPWTIIEVNYTFEVLFTSIQGGRFDTVTDLRGLEKRKVSSIARGTK